MLRPSFLSLAAAALTALVGCTVNAGDSTVLVLRNQAPQTGCIITADTSSGAISGGYYDLGQARATGAMSLNFGYQLTPLLQNESVADLADQAAIGRRTFIAEGAHVDITFNDTTEFSTAEQADLETQGLTRFDARFAGSVQPNGGLAAFDFEVVPAALMTKILTRHAGQAGHFASIGMVAKVVVFGQLGGGTSESHEFNYPVTVCDSCLLNDVGSCAGLPPSFMARTGGACLTNQDGVLDCCDTGDAAMPLLCPAAPPAAGGA